MKRTRQQAASSRACSADGAAGRTAGRGVRAGGGAGLALGCWYDVLRALRRRHPRLTVPADGLYCLTALLALLAFALYAGRGMMRLFALLGMGLGAMLWFLTLSPLALQPVQQRFGRF